eukprot:CAMPEP_0194111556 /NCGR_PEP_ID=MMETSP0150-20130528/10539_1 /TAXON_ID=122233 /ORGANISM="Chaetoceros debilis, Strain MM31A-1" /LENGTH=455 /DNA_ID=CAMNT_0038801031 /DNA_START=451 /DNA_END=1818 /DNA_ORIENTATION=+
MVMIKALLDSFSRCLGTEYQYQEQDEVQPSRTRRSSLATQSLSARAFQSNNEGNDEVLLDDTDATNTTTSLDQERCCSQLDLPVDFRLESRKNPTTTGTSTMDELPDNAQANVLAHVRQKASAAATATRRHKENSLSPSSSTLSRKASMEKARTISNKRKLDIFRNVEEPSTFSRLLGSPGSVFPGGAMLCFANPIFEKEEDDMRIRRRKDKCSDEVTIDEETITSTLYFDARYEHVVETRQPMPLYSDYSVLDGDSDNQIIKLYESGRHKHKPIHSIYCGNGPKLPPDIVNTSMVDSTSSDESDDNFEEIIASAGFAQSGSVSAYSNHHHQHHHQQQSRQDVSSNNNNVTYEMANTSSSSCMKMPSASLQLCEPRNNLAVIEDILEGNISHHELDMSIPGLKLMTQSSNSMTTATLTPVCSSRSNTSLSPKLNLKHDGFHFQNMNMNALSDVET